MSSQENSKNVGLTESGSFRAMENLQEIQRLPSISPINLNYFGAEQCESGYSFGPFVRMSYVIHIVRKGKGKLWKNGNEFEIEAGQAFLIYPGEETTYQADFLEPWAYMWVGFHGLMAEEVVRRAGFSMTSPVIRCGNMDQVQQVMDQLLSCCELTYVNDLMRTGYLYQLLALLVENSQTEMSAEGREEDLEKLYVERAVNLLINSDDPQIKVNEVARMIGISRGYLTRIFKKTMNVSPQDFQTRFRMEKAGDLLRSSESPVSVVAEKLGYTDVLSFSKSFRRHYGMSPTAFREQKVIVIEEGVKGGYTSKHPL